MTSLPRAAGLKFLRKHVPLVLLKEKAWHLGVVMHRSQQESTVLLPWTVLFLRGKSTSFSVLQPPTVDPADTHSRIVSLQHPGRQCSSQHRCSTIHIGRLQGVLLLGPRHMEYFLDRSR